MKTPKSLPPKHLPARLAGSFAAASSAAALLLVGAFQLLFGLSPSARAQGGTITVYANYPGVPIPSTLYGAFFEEINRAGDGGLYAEMIQNRSFEDDANQPIAWTLINPTNTAVSWALDTATSALNANNPTSLKLVVTNTAGGRVGVYNQGFKGGPLSGSINTASAVSAWETSFAAAAASSVDGLTVTAGKQYNLSLYARAAAFAGPLTATLEKADGTVLASQDIAGIGAAWSQFKVSLVATGSDTNARLVLSTRAVGTLWLDMVSLFPQDTFKGRANGLRQDLAQAVADMHPGFLRFPGGTFVNGGVMSLAERWKPTLGDVAQRPGHWSFWGYRTTNGLGYHEFLQYCEDIGAEPLFVINCGMDRYTDMVAVADLGPWVQDALDAIEYANGDASTPYGAMRAAAGHPAPFNLKYIEIGNENGYNFGGNGQSGTVAQYQQHYTPFYNAIKAKYPQVTVIANVSVSPMDMIDEHYYDTTAWFQSNATKYDSYSRGGPKVFVGELAVKSGGGNGNLGGALGEAAFMTGMERNADIVQMGSYAPLFSNPPWKDWTPNAINFTSGSWYGTPSYHTQKMFANNTGGLTLPSAADFSTNYGGSIGLSTWNTQSEYRNIVVTDANSNVLYASNFANAGSVGWAAQSGTWGIDAANAAYQQSGNGNDYRSLYTASGSAAWTNYTLNLQARKTGGGEGFLIMFYVGDANNWFWWNVGGWTNTKHGIERCVNGTKATLAQVSGSVNTNQWYNVTVSVRGNLVTCSLDGVVKQTLTIPSPVFTAASLRENTREIFLKAVNPSASALPTTIALSGVSALAPTAQQTVLTSASLSDENSFAAPNKVVPVVSAINTPAPQFSLTLAPYSITILRLQATPAMPQSAGVSAGNGQLTLKWDAVTGATSYTLRRATSANGPFVVVAVGLTATQYTDATVTNGVTYYYSLVAVNAVGESTAFGPFGSKPYAPISAQELVAPKIVVNGSGAGGGVSVMISPSVLGRIYQLQRTDNLSGGVWQNVGDPQTGTGGDLALTDGGAPNVSQRFWRVRLSP